MCDQRMFPFCFQLLQTREIIQIFKTCPSLKYQKALDIVANLKEDWLTMEISPSRCSTFSLSILQLLYKLRKVLLLECEMEETCDFQLTFKDITASQNSQTRHMAVCVQTHLGGFKSLTLNPKPCSLGHMLSLSKSNSFWFLSHLVISLAIFIQKF